MPDSTGSNDLYLSDLSPLDKPWDVHRANASVVQQLYSQSDLPEYAVRIEQCSKLLGFAFEAQDSEEFKIRLQQARFCRVRHCPVCQWRRSLMWRARFFQAVPRVREAYPSGRWVFLTLTVKNCPLEALRATLKDMNAAWKRLSEKKGFPALGFVRATEVTRAYDCYDRDFYVGRHGSTWVHKWEKENKRSLRLEGTDESHPHFHALLLVPASYFGTGYIKQETWRELWQQALRVDYLPVVNVKAVQPKKGATAEVDAVAVAVLETMKYGVKEADLMSDAIWLQELTKQLHKTRAISVGGVLKQFLKEEEPEDLIHAEDKNQDDCDTEVSVWFGWREMVARYKKVERC